MLGMIMLIVGQQGNLQYGHSVVLPLRSGVIFDAWFRNAPKTLAVIMSQENVFALSQHFSGPSEVEPSFGHSVQRL
jgi:hypothetical protein